MSDPLVIAHLDAPLDRVWAERIRSDLQAAWPEREPPTLLALETPSGTGEASGTSGPDEIAVTRAEVLRDALRDGRADLALQAYHRLPLAPAEDIRLVAVPQRMDPREALVSTTGKVLQYLGEGDRVGSLRARRSGQLLRRRSDLRAPILTGGVRALVAALDAGELEAFVASAAELEAMDLTDRIAERFDHDQMIPAPGQGGLAIEARTGDPRAGDLARALQDEASAYAILAERSCLARLGGRIGDPVGVHAFTDGEQMAIYGIVISADGTRTARMQWSGPAGEPRALGETLAELLIAIGGDKILSGQDIPPTVRYSLHPGGSADPEDGPDASLN